MEGVAIATCGDTTQGGGVMHWGLGFPPRVRVTE